MHVLHIHLQVKVIELGIQVSLNTQKYRGEKYIYKQRLREIGKHVSGSSVSLNRQSTKVKNTFTNREIGIYAFVTQHIHLYLQVKT